jgi:hypothetical protein
MSSLRSLPHRYCLGPLTHYLQHVCWDTSSLPSAVVTSSVWDFHTQTPTMCCARFPQLSCPCSVSIFKDPLVPFRDETHCFIFFSWRKDENNVHDQNLCSSTCSTILSSCDRCFSRHYFFRSFSDTVKHWACVLYTSCGVTQTWFEYLRGISNAFTEFITNRVLYPPIILL